MSIILSVRVLLLTQLPSTIQGIQLVLQIKGQPFSFKDVILQNSRKTKLNKNSNVKLVFLLFSSSSFLHGKQRQQYSPRRPRMKKASLFLFTSFIDWPPTKKSDIITATGNQNDQKQMIDYMMVCFSLSGHMGLNKQEVLLNWWSIHSSNERHTSNHDAKN